MKFLDKLTASAEELAAEVANNPGTARCQGCGSLTDPDVCHCGDSEKEHDRVEDHVFIAVGCDCFRADGESRAARKAWRARGINVAVQS